MRTEDRQITLKDGRQALLRPVRPEEDAEEMLEYLKTTSRETDFILRTTEECDGMTVEQEKGFLGYVLGSDTDLMIVCEVDGEIAGNCHLSFNKKEKIKHCASVAIGILSKFWNLGIGTAMFESMTEAARAYGGVELMELEYINGNERARALYYKAGFFEVAEKPGVIIQPDGTRCSLIYMQKRI